MKLGIDNPPVVRPRAVACQARKCEIPLRLQNSVMAFVVNGDLESPTLPGSCGEVSVPMIGGGGRHVFLSITML